VLEGITINLQPGINLPGTATFRYVAGDVEKIRFFGGNWDIHPEV
jgi:hypothetical protein